MRIAFYAPLKPPDDSTPSGDRQMARQLMAALSMAGHEVRLASRLSAFEPTGGTGAQAEVRRAAEAEVTRLLDGWTDGDGGTRPDLWLTYHPYYKAADHIGPAVCRTLSIPYATAEASYAGKRDRGPFAEAQAAVRAGLEAGAAHFCFTPDDREGLAGIVADEERLIDLPPFIDLARLGPAEEAAGRRDALRARLDLAPDLPVLIAVGMMRPGDKLASYRMLAEALARLNRHRFAVVLVGDGRERAAVADAFHALPAERMRMAGAVPPHRMADWYAAADLHVWPGYGEAYGLAYLEAQAMGLATVAQRIRGVPSVVRDRETGLLTPADDIDAYASAIAELLDAPDRRAAMGAAARRFVMSERTLERASGRLDEALSRLGVPA